MPKRQSRESTDDVIVPVSVLVPQGANPNPAMADVVQFQFVPGGLPPRSQPASGGWVDGFWMRSGQQLQACVRVGPGGAIALTPGRWAVWIKVIDNPTTPVEAVDEILIY